MVAPRDVQPAAPRLLSVDDARERILGLLPPESRLPVVEVPLAQAHGLVQSEPPGNRFLDASELAHLEMAGVTTVRCVRRPRVAVLANGDELVDVATEPGPGQVADVATPAISAALRLAGAEPVPVPRARDDLDDLRRAMREAAAADLVVSVAGVSVGDHDLVRVVLTELGALDFWRVAMRPGKPLAVGSVLGRPFIGLPGNPVSALVGFEVFVLPAVMALAGRRGWSRPVVEAEVAEVVAKPAGLRTFARARLQDRTPDPPLAHPVRGQGSFQLRWLAGSDALLALPEEGTEVAAGTLVPAVLIDQPAVPPPGATSGPAVGSG